MIDRARLLLGSALMTLGHRRLRSFLIVVTVAIGISAVSATVALTDGITEEIKSSTAKAGAHVTVVHRDLIYPIEALTGVKPGGLRCNLTWSDMRQLATDLPSFRRGDVVKPVEFVPADIGYAYVKRDATRSSKTVYVGTTAAYRRTIGYGVAAGRFLEDDDIEGARPVCVLDGGLARDIWGSDVDFEACVGRRLGVARGDRALSLEVVGILDDPFRLRERFKSFDTMRHGRPAIFSRLNMMNLYAPLTLTCAPPAANAPSVTLGGVALDGDARASSLFLRFDTDDAQQVKAYEARVKEWAAGRTMTLFLLRQWFWLEQIESLAGDADVAGRVIWIVILGVTVIMILVVNLVVVRERFREVAIRRAEGALRSDIVMQFLLEGMVTSLAGGVLGIAGGTLAAHVLSRYVTGWAPVHSATTFIIAITASLAVGLIATILPAWQVARLDPVKVLSKR